MQQKVLKTGNSLAVTIPAEFVKILGLRPGSDVKVQSDIAKGTLVCRFTGSGQMTLLPKK
jgi:antitoxin component of MazEF toxin-antitoxin module